MLTNLTASTEETQEAFETLVGAIKGLDLWHIATIVLLLLACMVVMKVLLRLLDRTFRRLEVEKACIPSYAPLCGFFFGLSPFVWCWAISEFP